MIIEFGIQANCSECSMVVYVDKINKKQKEIIKKWSKKKQFDFKYTPNGNLAIEIGDWPTVKDKSDLWALSEELASISSYEGEPMKNDEHYVMIRDESWDDLIKELKI